MNGGIKMLKEFKFDCDYVFDAQTFRAWGQKAQVGDFYINTKINQIGDGKHVTVIDPLVGMYGHHQIFPWYCREIRKDEES